MIKVTSIDNRGTHAVPFGYVYFDDDTRVSYAFREGIIMIMNGNWGGNTQEHKRVAKSAILKEFPHKVVTS